MDMGKLIEKSNQHLLHKKIYEALLDDNLWISALYRKEGSSEQTKYILKPQALFSMDSSHT
jgi:predicted nucleic acid-binding protein